MARWEWSGAATFMKVQGANSTITFTLPPYSAGVRLAAPVQISNYGYSSAVIFSPTMAASSDNQFVIGWELNNSWQHDIFFAVRNKRCADRGFQAPDQQSSWCRSYSQHSDGRQGDHDLEREWNGLYAVLTSTGSISKPKTMLNASDFDARPDAVQLPNGK